VADTNRHLPGAAPRGANRPKRARSTAPEARLLEIALLSAGAARDLDGPIGYLLANLAFLESQLSSETGGLPPDRMAELRRCAREALDGAGRLRNIVRDLQMGPPAAEDDVDVELHPLLLSCIKVARTEVNHRARVVTEFDAVPTVRGSETRLGRLFSNLIRNAAKPSPATPRKSTSSGCPRAPTRRGASWWTSQTPGRACLPRSGTESSTLSSPRNQRGGIRAWALRSVGRSPVTLAAASNSNRHQAAAHCSGSRSRLGGLRAPERRAPGPAASRHRAHPCGGWRPDPRETASTRAGARAERRAAERFAPERLCAAVAHLCRNATSVAARDRGGRAAQGPLQALIGAFSRVRRAVPRGAPTA
jgi:hypothetical protein